MPPRAVKHREVEHIIDALGDRQGLDPVTGFQMVKRHDGRVLRIADLVDDEGPKRDKVSVVLSRFRFGQVLMSGGLSFESHGAFPAQG